MFGSKPPAAIGGSVGDLNPESAKRSEEILRNLVLGVLFGSGTTCTDLPEPASSKSRSRIEASSGTSLVYWRSSDRPRLTFGGTATLLER